MTHASGGARPAHLQSEGARTRRIAFLVHSVLGLNLSLLLLFVSATGTVAVVADEVEWLFWDMARASTSNRSVSWGQQLASVRAAYPDHDVTYAVAGEEPYLTNRFELITPSGELRFAYVDPANGRVKGDAGFVTFQSVLRGLHYYLLLPGNWGFYLVTSLGFVLLISLVTGLMTFPRFWRRSLRRPRADRGSRVFWGELHRVLGVWLGVFVLIIGVTSIWYMGERFVEERGAVLEVDRVPLSAERLDALGPHVPRRLPLDTLLVRAREALPELVVSHIWFPENAEMPLFVRGQATAALVRERGNGVQLDPYSGEVLTVHRAEALRPLHRWVQTADPLHFGDFGGLWSKLVWFILGALLCLLMAAGAVVYIRRTSAAMIPLRTPPSARDLATALPFKHMHRWRWPTVALVVVGPVASYFAWSAPQFDAFSPARVQLAKASIGSWQASVSTDAPIPLEPNSAPKLMVRLCSGCYEQIREAHLAYGDANGPTGEREPLLGSANELEAYPRVPSQVQRDSPLHLWLLLRGWDGRVYRHAWAVGAW